MVKGALLMCKILQNRKKKNIFRFIQHFVFLLVILFYHPKYSPFLCSFVALPIIRTYILITSLYNLSHSNDN